ncbi:MAG: hypothetical protein ABEK36_00200 [Candidatus Aenigmatarchaeota archaeon]
MKGVTQIVGAILLILIAIGGAVAVLTWTRVTTRNYMNESEEQIDEDIQSSKAAFVIYNLTSNDITIKNIGKTDLKIDSFQVYVNNSRETITSYSKTGKIGPSENVTLTVTTDLKAKIYDVEVTGQYGLIDGVLSNTINW